MPRRSAKMENTYMQTIDTCPGTDPKEERVCCYPTCQCANQSLGLCLTGKCGCDGAAQCKFKRCRSCDMPIGDDGKALQMDVFGPGGPFVRIGDDEFDYCYECLGPLPKP